MWYRSLILRLYIQCKDCIAAFAQPRRHSLISSRQTFSLTAADLAATCVILVTQRNVSSRRATAEAERRPSDGKSVPMLSLM